MKCDPRILPDEDGCYVIYDCTCGYESEILGGSPTVAEIVSLDRKHRQAVRTP